MAALQCDICGGKLMGRPGGIFECDSCGMTYDTAWAKAKIQEIKGAVQVEGTVQVAGTVKIDGPVQVENGPSLQTLLKIGWLALEDNNWEKAASYFDKVLDRDPECAEAYFGKFHCRYKCQRNQYDAIGIRNRNPAQSEEAKNVLRFGSEELKTVIQAIGECHDKALEEMRARFAERERQSKERQEYEKRKKEEEERQKQEWQEKKRRIEKENAQSLRQIKIDKLLRERSDLEAELGKLKGLFSGKRRSEIEARLVKIEKELKGLK